MSRYTLLLLLLIIPFVSCKSLPQSDSSESMTLIPKTNGVVTSWKIEKGKLIIQSEDSIQISYDLDCTESIKILDAAETYRYTDLKRPDGLIRTMTLFKGQDVIAHIFQGLREGTVLKELEIVAHEEGSTAVILKSKDEEWIVPADIKMNIDWGKGEYTVYVSRIGRGEMADHPPFRCNLILLKK